MIASATGLTGIGGVALHIALGLSLVTILAWSARTLAPVRLTMPGLSTMVALAATASAAALLARYERVEAALVTHVVLAALLLAGLVSIARVAWRDRHGPAFHPRPI